VEQLSRQLELAVASSSSPLPVSPSVAVADADADAAAVESDDENTLQFSAKAKAASLMLHSSTQASVSERCVFKDSVAQDGGVLDSVVFAGASWGLDPRRRRNSVGSTPSKAVL
jgi:hypothetical protein